MTRHFLELGDHTRQELDEILALATRLKAELKSGQRTLPLQGKALAMIFEKPSLRTRVTFELGIVQLGGYPVYLTPNDIQLAQRETVADIGRNLGRWVDIVMARTFSHQTILELSLSAGVPVINGLSDLFHPCQLMADLLTIQEKRGRIDGLRVAFVGDANNMANSWINAATKFDLDLVIACPEGYDPTPEMRERARRGRVSIVRDVAEAARGADVLYTDVWTSMGQEAEAEERRRAFSGFQINSALIAQAKAEVLVMHCLPAHRGEEITAEAIEAPQSVIFDQAENRLHAQKGVLVWLEQ
ncbi:MAG TPA: ornithine carbamoyltransferase [Terriglobales bacterium]|nr:ornithine carbamoyltransferase [Terriglobales bacterium]